MIPGPPDEDIYLRDLERHLGRKHSGATPLISVSQNLLRVLVHALRRSRQAGKEGKNEWSIAVISLSRISSSIRAVWNLDAGVHSRRAFGEWVVYGAIPSSNVLCVLSVDKLLLLLSQVPAPFHVDVIKKAKSTRSARKAMATAVNRRLTHGDGVMFGCLLLSLGIPKRYIEYVCTTILADWRFPEHETWLSNKDFVQGLSEAYQRKPRGFTSIAATIEQDRNSRGARPMYNANATVSDPIYDHEWLPSFLTEVEQAAFGAKQTDYITPAHQHEPMAKAESYHESGWKMESPDYVVLDATPVHFKSKPTEF
ncbi:MAG: hypothetical protein LQ343_001247 [Gyalolechia ehrenbergii]|nr:MAG: hypothetical protein LQ343_001247 [Gyalolechia ehrenbergii]